MIAFLSAKMVKGRFIKVPMGFDGLFTERLFPLASNQYSQVKTNWQRNWMRCKGDLEYPG